MTLTIALASSAVVAIAFWAAWPILKADMDNAVDMTALSVMTLAGLLFVGGMTTLAALS